jgi:hypothetical protein
MNDLDDEDRALLDRARGGHEPSEADRRRVRRALAASIGVAGGLATTTAVGTSAAAGAGAAKLVALVVVSVAVGAGGGVTVDRIYRADAEARAVPVAPRVQPREPELPAPAPTPVVAAVAPPVPPEPLPAAAPAVTSVEAAARRSALHAPVPEPRPAGTATAPSTFVAPAATVAPRPPTTIEAEARMLRDGIAALHAGNPAGALALFDEHARRYADGVLAEERSAERVIALHELGRTAEANAAAAAFLHAYPGSHLAARIRAASNLPTNP